MIPRTVCMAQEVAAQLSSSQVDAFGNVILNGYLSVIPNTINKKAWQYSETTTAPVDLPSLSCVQPALKGWTTNYMEYYTKLQPNGYCVNPGDPTMFAFGVRSFTPDIPAYSGIISTTGALTPGSGYLPGTYTNVYLSGGTGSGAVGTMTVSGPVSGGAITTTGSLVAGTGYTAGTYSPVALTGGSGTGATGTVVASGSTALGEITGTGSLVGGSGYTTGTYAGVALTGGTGTGAQATVTATAPGGGCITTFTINGGSGYTPGFHPSIALVGGTGTGAYGFACVVQPGGVTAVQIIDTGAGTYPTNGNNCGGPTRTITGSGTGLALNFTWAANALSGIQGIACGGSGYNIGDQFYVGSCSGAGVCQGIACVTAYTPPGPGYVCQWVFPALGRGTGYTIGDVLTAPTIPGGGAGFTLTVTGVGGGAGTGAITSAIITSGGTGYTVGDVLTGTVPGGTGWSTTVTSVGTGGAGGVTSFTLLNPGSGYTAGDVLTGSVPGGTGWSITATAVTPVSPGGQVTSFTLTVPGSGYTVGDILTTNLPGGSGWSVPVTGVTSTPAVPGFEPRWGQVPRRFFQNQTASFVPPNNNPQAIPYSFIYPVADNTTAPPIDGLS